MSDLGRIGRVYCVLLAVGAHRKMVRVEDAVLFSHRDKDRAFLVLEGRQLVVAGAHRVEEAAEREV